MLFHYQLESCDDSTGETRYPSHIGELEQTEDPINASKTLKWIEPSQSREVAESIRVNEDLLCRMSPTEGCDREGLILRLDTNVFGNSVTRLRGKSVLLWWFVMSTHLFWNVWVGRRILSPATSCELL